MASQPSIYNEERNRLRLQAWEQRNQESNQSKELIAENVPLFGEPYKTNKGDELSSRIQRMLGSYEDVKNPNPFPTDPSPTPTYVTCSQSDQCQPDKSTKPPNTQVHYMTTQTPKGPCSNSHSSQPMRTSTASSSPHQGGHSSTFSKASLNHSQGTQLGHSALEQNKSDTYSDLRDRVSLPQEMSDQSPDAKPLHFLHSDHHDHDNADTGDTIEEHQLQGPAGHISTYSSTMDVSTLSPKDASLPQANKTTTLPCQTFPPLLSSKQPSAVMIRKPTAYVRPMDGQDQVVSESPELKPSPEPYAPLAEIINKSDQGKTKMLPQFLEAKTNEAQCVEEILRLMVVPCQDPQQYSSKDRKEDNSFLMEMTQSWPPLLTTIRTPSTDEPSKSPFSTTEAEHVASCPGQKSYGASPSDPSQLSQQNSSLFEVAHSSGVESSSSDSESSSRSESESESVAEKQSQPTLSSSVKTEPDVPAVSRGDWQLGNWIRSNQHSSSTESQAGVLVSESPAHKPLLSIQSSKHSSVDVVNPIRESKLSCQQKEFSDNVVKTQQCKESPQDTPYQQSTQQSPSLDSCKLSGNVHSSKPAMAGCLNHTEAALGVKHEDVSATRAKEPRLTDRPKVKTKTRRSKKSKAVSETKRDGKRASEHTSLDKQKTGSEPEPEVALALYGQCSSCGVRYPNPCSCTTQSPGQPDQLSPAPPVTVSCSKIKLETTSQKSIKKPPKTTHKHLETTRHTSKGSGDYKRPVTSLLVKIDLHFLSRVPQTSRSHQEMPNHAKRSALVTEQDGAGGEACTIQKRTKSSKKSIPQKAEVDSKTRPRKKQKLENKNTSSHASAKLDNPPEDKGQKKAKKTHVQSELPLTPKDTSKDSKLHKCNSGDTQESSKDTAKRKDSSKHKRKSVKQTEHPHTEKKALKSSPTGGIIREALTNRPLLKFQDRQYPVKHYIKEAKKLKHKADAETDKLSKAFNYLDAAMFFVESGIAMEKDPQISMSSYTMFAETVELLKFVLKLKNSVDLSVPPSEKDFLALCLKCQSLLQMTMFRHKHKIALEYSKTLTDHFNSSAQAPHDPAALMSKETNMPSMPSPANTSAISGPGSSSGLVVCSGGSAVAVPHAIEQVAFTYVNITTLFLSAHDIWEQAEELAHKGSGMLTELDTVMGPLSLTSSMSSMVHYTRQGVHWLRLDNAKVK